MKLFSRNNRPAVILVAILILFGLAWFTIPNAIMNTVQALREVKKNHPKELLSQEDRDRFEKDIRDLTQAIKTGDKRGEPDFLQHYVGMGNDYKALGMLDFAEDAYHRASGENTINFVPYLNLGSLYEQRGDFDKAINAYQSAIERAPSEVTLYRRLADLYQYQLKDPRQARGVYIEGTMKTNNDPALLHEFAPFLEQIGEPQEALLYYEVLVKKEPENKELLKHYEELKSKTH